MNVIKIKCIAEQIRDSALALSVLMCLPDDVCNQAVIQMHKENLQRAMEAMANEREGSK